MRILHFLESKRFWLITVQLYSKLMRRREGAQAQEVEPAEKGK